MTSPYLYEVTNDDGQQRILNKGLTENAVALLPLGKSLTVRLVRQPSWKDVQDVQDVKEGT